MTHMVGIYTQTATATPAPAPISAASDLQARFAWLSTGTTRMVRASQDSPMSDQLAAEIREALAQVERGEVVDLGSFAQYADDDSED